MPTGLYLLAGFFVGAILGLVVGWLYARGRNARGDSRLEAELRQQLSAREGELMQTRRQLSEVQSSRAALEAKETFASGKIRELEEQSKQLQAQSADLQQQMTQMLNESSTANAQLKAERAITAQLRDERNQAAGSLQKSQSESLDLKERNGKLEAQTRFLEERLATERIQLESL